jgi:two-component system, OmpR family, response regulator VicR
LQKIYKEVYPVYLTSGAVARHCGVSKVTVLRWIEKGNVTAFKLPGGQNRISQDDFFAFANKHGIPIRGNQPAQAAK